ncbi:hypothetical protein JCM5353_007664 [Sporobolomyces roseus]
MLPPLNYSRLALLERVKQLIALETPENWKNIQGTRHRLESITDEDWNAMSHHKEEFDIDGKLESWTWTKFLCVAIEKTAKADIDDSESKEIECLKRSFVALDPLEVEAIRKESVGAQTGLNVVEVLLGRIKDSLDLAHRHPEEHTDCLQTASRVDELEKIKHHGISGMVQSIQDELRKTGEQDWKMMVSETDARGVLLERRICQELVAVQKDIRQLVALKETVTQFRTILIKHSVSLSFKPLRAVIQSLSSSSLPEVDCLKISLLSLRINDIETSRETNDPDGKILNTVRHCLDRLAADLRLAAQKTQEQGLHHEKEVAQLNETIVSNLAFSHELF